VNLRLEYREGPSGWGDYLGERIVRAGDRLELRLSNGTAIEGFFDVALHRPGMGSDRQPLLLVGVQCVEHPAAPCACDGPEAEILLHPLMVVRHAEPSPSPAVNSMRRSIGDLMRRNREEGRAS